MNDLAIAMGIGIDKADDQYLLSVQAVVPNAVAANRGSSGGLPVVTYKSQGKTIFEAMRRMTTVSPRKIYAAHLRVLVLGETLAREGIADALDFLTRDHELRSDYYIVVARAASAEAVLKRVTALERIPANKLYTSLQISEKVWAPASTVTLNKLIQEMVTEGKSSVISAVEVWGDSRAGATKNNIENIDPPGRINANGLAIFRKDRLIGWLNETESTAYNFLVNNVRSSVVEFPCPKGGSLAAEVIRSDTRIKGKVVDGKPRVDIFIRAEVNIGEVACSIDLMNERTIKALENAGAEELKSLCLQSIRTMQRQYRLDIYGFGEAIHRAAPAAWSKLRTDWNGHFANMDVSIEVDYRIRRLGTIGNAFKDKIKE